ncbi:type II secretion system protein [Campylobacter sp. RM12654]|uniref:type II secretion system protein n=1 Tax=unclassified Campylobacter TaxID=2593542 RepID=UPI001BDB2378|nr:type II secretion system protein [Campylobacter sp. 2018MI01]MBT0877835.1 type II secretion system GspH family protein [Campylobacter sp. 2018MI01]MBZ7977313.1 type II secretion system protein [Campylobacter sp. RM12654]
MVKQAFTMIELIFVIVILGALAAVAIPKLNATRDDAEIVKANQNITLLIGDLASYYTAHNEFAKDIKTMTNVALDSGVYKVKNKPCLEISLDDYYVVIKKSKGQDKVCDIVLNDPKIISNLTGRISKTNNNFTDISKSDVIYIPVGGSNVVY